MQITSPTPSYHELLEAIQARDLDAIHRLSGVRLQSAELLDGIDEEYPEKPMCPDCGDVEVEASGLPCRRCEEVAQMYDAADRAYDMSMED